MKKTAFLSAILSLTSLVSAAADPADMVDLFMGVRGNSNCVIGPQLPHGSVNPSPQTPHGGQNGYDENDRIRGFGQLHVSGIGWSRYGQIFLSPQIGFSAKEDGHDSPKSDETATPYYYKVSLDRYGIKAEMAPTHHAVAYRFTYPEKKRRTLLLDMRHSIPEHIVPMVRGTFNGGSLSYDKERNTISGYGEYAGGFGSEAPYRVYFSMRLSDPGCKVTIVDRGARELYARIDVADTVLDVGIGVSMRSVQCAEKYRYTEIDDRSVEVVAAQAKAEWNRALARIAVDGGAADKRLFYTALYHSLVMPRDRSGDNPEWQSQMAHIDDHYCVWDTWRTCYPLLTLIEESFVAKTVNSFIDRLEHHGKCTTTFTASMEWDSKQGGDDVDNVIADAMLKNVGGFDRERAYGVMLHNARKARCPEYLEHGWIPGRSKMMSCSYTMEYAYNDDCCSRIAALMGDTVTARELACRSGGWERMFNPALESDGFAGFIAPREADGTWVDIDPKKVYGPWVDYFYEGNSWCYTLFTPSAFDRLISLCGGKEEMVRRLRHGFDNKLIDQSNEPGFLAPFIFSRCDRPDLTAMYVGDIRRDCFSIEKGYPDNEDSGAMGSWYVFTSIGLFPDAGHDYYYLLPPAFDNVSLTMENGKKIVIRSRRKSPDARFISSVTVNGCRLNRSWIRHDEIAQGAVIEMALTDNPLEWMPAAFDTERQGIFGVNLAGAEFFHKKMDGVGRLNIDYHYPDTMELDYWASKGMRLIRLPFKWERLQREVGGELSADELDYIRYLLREADARGMKILLDMHNYGRRNYMGKSRIIGDTLMPHHFAQAWGAIARALKDSPALYGYGLCNEPHDMLDGCPWAGIAQAAIDSIRTADCRTPIVVAGNTWSSAERWPYVNDGLEDLSDPADNIIYEAHCYFDRDASGIYRGSYDDEGAYPTIGIDRVRPFADWLKKHGKRGILGEYGVPADDPRWLECLDLFLEFIADNGIEGTYWAGGARWNKYILGVHPENDYATDRPQVGIMTKYRFTR